MSFMPEQLIPISRPQDQDAIFFDYGFPRRPEMVVGNALSLMEMR
jgi:hypothetical protein